jgi:hypothetical protein
LAERKRRELEQRTGRDFSELTDCEALDAIEYFVFPNFVPWAGYTTPLTYRFRPLGCDPASSLMDIWLLEPTPVGEPRPAAAKVRLLEIDQPWREAPELGFLGPILDQDTATLERVQRGLATSKKPGITLAHYQESRIRHFHSTLDRYLGT